MDWTKLPKEDVIYVDKDDYVLNNPVTKTGSLYIEKETRQCKVGDGERYNSVPYTPWSISTSATTVIDVQNIVTSIEFLDVSKKYIWDGGNAYTKGNILSYEGDAWVSEIPQDNSFAWVVELYKLYFWDGSIWNNVSANSHNALLGIQGGVDGERYHVDEDTYDIITNLTWRQPVDVMIDGSFPEGVEAGYRVAVSHSVPDDTYDSFDYRGMICEYDGAEWIAEDKDVGQTVFCKNDTLIYSWTGTVWKTSSIPDDFSGIIPITPVSRNCLTTWNDTYGAYLKDAGKGAFVPFGLAVLWPYGEGISDWRLKITGGPNTESYCGIAELHDYYSCRDPNHCLIGFVSNMIRNVKSDVFGGGLLINAHGPAGPHYMEQHNPHVCLAVKPENTTNVVEGLRVYESGLVECLHGVNIPIDYTYNVSGVPHHHDAKYLLRGGDTFGGNFNAGNHYITGLPTPVSGSDAVNKDYVDGMIVSIIWQTPVASMESDPPVVDGRYLVVSTGAFGVFIGHEDEIATLTDGTWTYETPVDGWGVGNLDNGFCYVWNNDKWVQLPGMGNHASLQGLSSDDHLQYVHISNARNISAVHTFNNGTVPFNVVANGRVDNLNVQYLSGKTAEEFAPNGHTHDFDTLENFEILNLQDGQGLVYDSEKGKFVNDAVGSSNILTIDPDHQFDDNTERDAYFVLHPDEMNDGVFISVGAGFQQYNELTSSWDDRTPILRGANGQDGRDGIDGDPGPAGDQGIQGPQGPAGPQGVAGADGAPGVVANIKGAVATVDDLPETAEVADAYVVNATGDCWIYSTEGWVNAGEIVGPQGQQGIQGPAGPQGIAGPIGPTGLQGPIGLTGPEGPIGPRGPSGITTYWKDAVEGIKDEPPVNFEVGDKFLVSPTPTNSVDNPFKDYANCVAEYADPGQWVFEYPLVGCMVYDEVSVCHRKYTGLLWDEWKSGTGISTWDELQGKPDVATLTDGKIPESQLPSYVDDVIECANDAARPVTGEDSKIYVVISTNKTYRWTGTTYVEIGGGGVALGETSATAYYGDKGKTAYDHSQSTHAPSNAQKNSDITKGEIEAVLIGTISSHSHSSGTPSAHATTHVTGGADVIADAIAAGNSGLMSGADKTKLDGITLGTAANNVVQLDANAKLPAVDGSQLTGIAGGFAKVSANDTTPGVLNGKLVAGSGISLTEGTDGGNETLTIANAEAFTEVSTAYPLPTPVVGKMVDIVGKGSNWTVTATSNAVIQMGADASVANGVLSSTNGYDCVTLICISTTKWVVKSAFGILTLV